MTRWFSPAAEIPTAAAPLPTLTFTVVPPASALTRTPVPARTKTPFRLSPRRQLDVPIGTDYKFVIHKIAGGENMNRYAEQYHTTTAAIQSVNYKLRTPLRVDALIVIPVGFTDVSNLPRFEAYIVADADKPVESLAQELGVDPRDLKYYNVLSDGEKLKVGDWLLIPRARPTQ